MSLSMKQVEERHNCQEIKILLWSDRMDLLAIANFRGEVSLHRLNWQRVWFLQPFQVHLNISGMAWRPDGKVLAIGYSSFDIGHLILVDVETKDILYTQNFNHQISCVIWFNAPDTGLDTIIEDDSSTFLSELPDLMWDSNSPNKIIPYDILVDNKQINILLTGTENSSVHISIFGLFECAVVNIKEIIKENCKVLSAHMSNDLSHLYTVVKCVDSNLIKVVSLDTSIFKSHAFELHTVAYTHGKIISLLNYLKCTIKSIETAWETILLEMDSKLATYASSVPEGAVAADFLDLLLFGFPSYELELFLTQDLTEKGLRKLGHSIECSYSNIQKLVLKHLTKVGQNITYNLSELRGMARMEFRYKKLGLQEDTVSKAISASGSFLVKGSEMQQVIDHSMRNYKTFFRWLYVVILRGNEEHVPAEMSKVSQRDITFIGEFLKNFESLPNESKTGGKYFNLERLGQYLVDSNLTIPIDVSSNAWDVFLNQNPELLKKDIIIEHHHEMSLIQEHQNLIDSITNVFNEPKIQINQQLHLAEILNLLAGSNNLQLSMINYDKNITFIGMIPEKNSEYLYFIELDNRNDVKKCAVFYFQVAENQYENIPAKTLKINDIQFYNSSNLSLLLEIDNGLGTPVFAQLPTILARIVLCPIDKNLNLNTLEKINGCSSPINTPLRVLDGFYAVEFAVSGARKVAVILMNNMKTVHLYEMEVDEDDEEEEGDVTLSTNKESDASGQDINDQSIID